MADKLITLGYEIGTGECVAVPLRHLAVTGQTQESGKTTTLEALVTRSERRAIAFVTKRGEGGFTLGRRIAPFFQERADWEYVQSILESTFHERMKFERAWIVRACKGAKTLAEVQRNITGLMQGAKRSMDADMYMLLNEYLGKVVPLIARLPKSPRIDLVPGLNVMDLLDYPEELQMLVMASTLRWIHTSEKDVIVVIPEAWKFVPQSRKTPVRSEVERLVREGAGLKNYIWLDSQDIAGVDKILLRAASVWIIGVQREMNELKRAIGNMPAGIKRPNASAVAQLGVGEFFACWHDQLKRVYVQPSWMTADGARRISLALDEKPTEKPTEKPNLITEEEDMSKIADLEARNAELENEVKQLRAELARARGDKKTEVRPETKPDAKREPSDLDTVYSYVRERILRDPLVLRVLKTQPEISVEIQRETVTLDGNTLRGKLAELIARGFFDEPRKGQAAYDELWTRQHFQKAKSKPNVYNELNALAGMGFLTKESEGYQAVKAMRVNLIDP